MKIAILGFAREGHSILEFLKKDKEFKDTEIWILDKSPKVKIPAGVKKITGPSYLKSLESFDIVFRSPGIPYLLPEIQKAKKQGVEISSVTNLFFERCPGTIIGITGTKGKGTTSTLVYKILKAAGRKAFLAGNIGKPILDILSEVNKKSLIVFELSSFQLQDLQNSPHIAAVLDVFPDHLDAHKNLKEYYDAKANIGRYQKSGDKIFFFKNSELSRYAASKGKGKKIGVNEKIFRLFLPKDLSVEGTHNFKNAVMAATVAKSFGVPEKIIMRTVKNFRGLEHRMEFVKNVSGVRYLNDSAAVNPGSATAALETTGRNTILIAGGKERGLDYSNFCKAIKKYAKSVILIGENKNKISKVIKSGGASKSIRIIFANSMSEAVRLAHREGKPGDIVLLSPASASFDMFKDYGERGEVFKRAVKKLK